MTGIYKITNPKNKVYVGQSIDINRRWEEYVNLRKDAIGVKLYNSLKKYGPNEHKFEIIEECKSKQLDKKEIYWGLFFDVLNPKKGLNLKLGNSNGKCSEKTKERMSVAKKGKPNLKLRGFKYTIESKQKMSIAKNKPIIQCDLQDNPIKEWPSLSEATKYLNKPGSTPFISKACRGEKELAYGFKWKFKSALEECH